MPTGDTTVASVVNNPNFHGRSSSRKLLMERYVVQKDVIKMDHLGS